MPASTAGEAAQWEFLPAGALAGTAAELFREFL